MTGDRPGVTRKSQLFEISADPLVYVMDTPGVMPALSDDAHPGAHPYSAVFRRINPGMAGHRAPGYGEL